MESKGKAVPGLEVHRQLQGRPLGIVFSGRYDFGMTRKIAVSLPDEQVEMIQRAVQQGRAASVSGFISQAVARADREDSLRLLLEELDRELGAVSAEDLAWADRELGLR